MTTNPAPESPGSNASLTLVTVFFDAEIPLIGLQLRSLARHLDGACAQEVILIYNESRKISRRARARLVSQAGHLASRLTILNREDVVHVPETIGWRAQQILKLHIAELVVSEKYILLDAKNHLIRRTSSSDFVAQDGRSRGGQHSYADHPLKPLLIKTSGLFGLPSGALVAQFPGTATPFVMETRVVRALLAGFRFGGRSTFAESFEAAGVTEFFLYSCWILQSGTTFDELYDGTSIESPTVWAGASDLVGVRRATGEAIKKNSAFFAVHRRALGKLRRPARTELARYWASTQLFPTSAKARAFIFAYRCYYFPAMAIHKARNAVASRRSAVR